MDDLNIPNLSVKLFADGADKAGMIEMYKKSYIKGFTTNPTLMKKAGVTDYRVFAKDILKSIKDRPISFEVFSDDLGGMEKQAMEISSWGENVNVKIPVTNTEGKETYDLVRKLSRNGVKVNVTAVMTLQQVENIADALRGGAPAYVSVFAGRIADTGRNPVLLMRQAVNILKDNPHAELIWASPRELLNIFQANDIGCHIITATNDILKKLQIVGKPLGVYSLETVRMFRNDAVQAGFAL